MIKKYVGMLVASGLAGVVALACTVTTGTTSGGVPAVDDGGTPVAQRDAGKSDSGKVVVDSGPVVEADAGVAPACYSKTIAASFVVPAAFKFVAPKAKDAGKCSPADLLALQAEAEAFTTGPYDYAQVVKSTTISAECKTCATVGTATAWPAFPEKGTAFAVNYWGSGLLAGDLKNNACASADYERNICISQACGRACTGATDAETRANRGACIQYALQNACEAIVTKYEADCQCDAMGVCQGIVDMPVFYNETESASLKVFCGE